METRANYILIGAFTLAGIIGAFGFLLWLAKIDVDRQYAYYDVLFDNVAGLSSAGDVRYNGLPVGQVVDLRLDAEDPAKVRVRLELDATTPVHTDTVAQLQSQGVTGVSYVALSGGSADAPRLPRGGVIQSESSALQSIFEGAPQLLEKAIALLEDVREVLNDDNRMAVSDMLSNLSSASGRLDSALADFETLSGNLGEAAQAIAGFTDRLETLSDTAEVTLQEATETLQGVRGAVDNAGEAFATADGLMQGQLMDFIERGAEAARTLDSVVKTLEPSVVAAMQSAQGLIGERLPELVAQLQDTAAVVEDQVAIVGEDASRLMARYEDVGAEVQARVAQAESAISALEGASLKAGETLESVRRTSDVAGSVLEEDIRPLADEATATMATARDLAEQRLPGLIDQTQSTLATVETEARALSGSAQVALAEATARLGEAQATLTAFRESVAQAEDMLASVTETSDIIGALVREDGAALVADARVAAQEARAAIETINVAVQDDLPGMMADVRDAAQTANRVIDEVGAQVGGAAGTFDRLADESGVALAAATDAFANANETLAAISTAMESAEGTLGAAEQTFTSVNAIIDEDIDGMVVDIRRAVDAFTTTVTGVSDDFDRVADEVLAASESAADLMATVDGIVQANRLQVSEFMRIGLPQFVRFIEESRLLVGNLERLAKRVERDPARFLLGTQNSEFRR